MEHEERIKFISDFLQRYMPLICAELIRRKKCRMMRKVEKKSEG
jgi:hypothetical protein